jgi:hypothetical protein
MFKRKKSSKQATVTYKKVPKSYYDMTVEEQFEWIRELLEGVRPDNISDNSKKTDK